MAIATIGNAIRAANASLYVGALDASTAQLYDSCARLIAGQKFIDGWHLFSVVHHLKSHSKFVVK